jgi:hypothetical protein
MIVERQSPSRSYPRFECSLELRGSQLRQLGVPYDELSDVQGRIENISKNSLCLLSKRSISPSSLVRCEIGVCGTDTRVPTLMQVRWARRNAGNDGYQIGLQFLL